ncbi:YgfZ/GcvT domain-containing protein [Acuticoccus kandeliae]|uniref:CAF17-like 4Fe-4S cluster assembly/insertion protein YgfZ n=1 Tax=Acuticoccus kandeliae TaxID=2073160 RepID=UPI000D3E88D1|nr:folate-binding protein YgfZ [Acuticoccus kandeliae]
MNSLLPGRAVISITGADRLHFLEGLLSCHVEEIAPGEIRYGALLTPQGKILTDMMVHGFEDRIALDVPAEAASDLVRRLTLYRLRAAVGIEATDEIVTVGTDGTPDPRGVALGHRAIAPAGSAEVVPDILAAYQSARIDAAIADAGVDFELGDVFPHDINMDVTGGVDFNKGCFVGQEVVSRMRHRGTARRRTVIVEGERDLPAPGASLSVGGKDVGRLGTSVGPRGIAVLRIDRVADSAEIDGAPVSVRVAPGAPFALTGAEADA